MREILYLCAGIENFLSGAPWDVDCRRLPRASARIRRDVIQNMYFILRFIFFVYANGIDTLDTIVKEANLVP